VSTERPTAALVLALLLLGLPGGRPAQSSTASSALARPNVILITMDTLRADHLGCYGSKQVETPTLDALANDGVVFERAIAQVPLTWPSHAAILTGTYPFQNGVQDFTGHPLDPRFRSLAQGFKQAGYATGAVVSSFVLDRSWGLARGFDSYDDAFSATAFEEKDLGLVDRKADESVTHALQWLGKTPRRPFFLWLHLYDPHSPYDPPEPYRTKYRDHLYDGEIAYADHELGRLIAWFKSRGIYDSSLIVFVSDHGESLGEHGEREHGFFIYNATTHVPLIVKPPARSRIRPGRQKLPVETIALAPTLVGIAGIRDPLEKQFQARSLFDTPEAENEAAYSETFYPFSSFGWSPLHGLETARYHYIDAPDPELYDEWEDPAEKNNLAAQQPATVAVLKSKIADRLSKNPFLQKTAETGKLDPDTAEKLRTLGYVAYQSPVSTAALAAGLPDPKGKLWELNAILDAGDALRANDFDKGTDLLKRVRERDPDMYVIPYMLGQADLRQQNWGVAASELQRALALNPGFDQAMTALARAQHEQGDDASARRWLKRALDQNLQNYRAWYELGWLESKAGNKEEALTAYSKALAIQPNFGPAQRDAGMAYFGRKEYPKAALYLGRAKQLGINEATLLNYLGICYSLTGRLPLAVRTYRQAIELDASLADAHLNLGYAYEKLKQGTLAHREYQEACRLQASFCQLVESRSKRD
jgi:arylsulfatase A-like enzyme/Flp pilus assembly protein TadD